MQVSTTFVAAPYQALRGVVYCEILGLENLTNAVGLTNIALGFGIFIGIAISGTIISATNDYGAVYIFAGLTFILCGILILILPHVHKIMQRKRKNKK